MTQIDIIKLKYVPSFEIVNLIRNNYNLTELKELLLDFDSKKTNDPMNKLSKLSRSKLLNFCTSLNFHQPSVDRLFKEYVHTKNPSIFFYSFNNSTLSNFYTSNNENSIKESILTSLQNQNQTESEEFPELKNITIDKVSKDRNIIELEFSFESRIEYIDPATHAIKFVYTWDSSLVWISIQNKAIIFNTRNSNKLSYLTIPVQNLLGVPIRKYNIPKEIDDKLFGFDTIKRATFIEPDENEEYNQVKNVSDNNFSTKKESKELNDRCERPSTLHRCPVLDNDASIRSNENGKLNIYKHFKKSDLKNWGIEIIARINEYISELSPADFIKLKTIDELTSTSLSDISTNKGKHIFKNLVVAVQKIKSEELTSVNFTNVSLKDIACSLGKYFIPIFRPICENCSESIYTHICGNHNSLFFDGNMKLKCSSCDTNIENFSEEIKCINDSRHKFNSNLFDNIILISNTFFIKTFNEFSEEFNLGINLPLNTVVRFKGSSLEIKENSGKHIYHFDEITDFRNVTKKDEIEPALYSAQLTNLVNSTEKCPNHSSENCVNCLDLQQGLCVQRLVAQFGKDAHLRPHSGTEYGDMKLDLDIDVGRITFYGIAKSCAGNISKVLTLKNNEGLKLMAQCFEMFMDARVKGIAIISSAIIDDRLTETLKQMARFYNKKILFIEREHILRLMIDYLKPLPQLTVQNYWIE